MPRLDDIVVFLCWLSVIAVMWLVVFGVFSNLQGIGGVIAFSVIGILASINASEWQRKQRP